MSRLILAALALFIVPAAVAQSGLQLRTAVVPDGPGVTDGMQNVEVENAPGLDAWVGPVLLDLPSRRIVTVGLEVESDGRATLSLWLDADAASELYEVTSATVGSALAVVYGGRVLAAPIVGVGISNGLVQVTGLDGDVARALARELRAAIGVDSSSFRSWLVPGVPALAWPRPATRSEQMSDATVRLIIPSPFARR